jgi:hypothetical protein
MKITSEYSVASIRIMLLMVLICGMIAVVSAATPVVTVSGSQSFTYKGVEVQGIDVIDLLDPSVSHVDLAATGENDLKSIAGPEIRYITRDYPAATITIEGFTISVNEVGEVDRSGLNTYHLYSTPVIPTINANVPGESGNILLIKVPDIPDADNLMDLKSLLTATDAMYMYTDGGIIHCNPQTNSYTLWGSVNPGDYDPSDFAKTLKATEVDLDAYAGDAVLAQMMGDIYPETIPAAGEYACYIFRYDPDAKKIVVLGMAAVIILDQDRSLTWDGSAEPGTWQDGGDTVLSFEDGDDVAGCAYMIVRKNTVFDAEMSVNSENLKALKNHPTITVSCLFDFLKQQVPGHTYANSPIELALIVDGVAQSPDDLYSVIPISTGYGVAGAGSGGAVTVTESVLSGLGDGTYLVILLGIDGDGSIVALDQKEVVIGSGTGGASYYQSDNTDWSELDISKTRKVLTVKDSGTAGTNPNPNIAEIESLSGDGSETGDAANSASASAAGDASVKDMNVANAAAIGAEPAGTANPFGGVSLTPTTLGYTVIGLIVLGAAGMMLSHNRPR